MNKGDSADIQTNRLIGLLEEALLPSSHRAAASCELIGPIHDGSRSVIFRGEGSLFPHPVAVKQCKTMYGGNRTASDDARIQFHALQAVSEAFENNAELAVPRPVALIENEGIIISEWIDGFPLTQSLHDPAKPVAEIELGVIAAGRWLAAFHACRSSERKPLDTGFSLALVDDAMNATYRQFQRRSSVRRVRASLEAKSARVSTINAPISWTHGDFTPDNILICDGRTVGIDVGANFTNATLYDVSHFLNNLEISLYHPKGLRLLPHRDRLIEAFRTSYGSLDEMVFPETWLRLSSALRLRAELWASGRGARRIYNDLCIAFLIRRLARTLRKVCD